MPGMQGKHNAPLFSTDSSGLGTRGCFGRLPVITGGAVVPDVQFGMPVV